MTYGSIFVFRMILGALFVAQYFLGFDGHGRGAGNIITLGFGVAFLGYGLFGFLQKSALQKKRAALLAKAGPAKSEEMDEEKSVL